MRIRDFINECKIEDSNTEEVLHCHPKQFINPYLRIPVWRVKYKYLTLRDNEKEATKYILNYTEEEWDGVENEFNNYMKDFNEKYPERSLSNVEILVMDFIGYLDFEFD